MRAGQLEEGGVGKVPGLGAELVHGEAEDGGDEGCDGEEVEHGKQARVHHVLYAALNHQLGG